MAPANPHLPLTAERWARIEALFHEARELAPAERRERLSRLSGSDASLSEEVQELIDAFEETGRPAPAPPRQAPAADLAGRRLGNYQLDRLLGTGGMGSVYLAHRCDGQFDRVVALKMLGAHLRSEFFADQFAVERRLLAGLDHPNITRLLDGGVSADGDPYLVMEYVDGTPIGEYCDRNRLNVVERVRLFLQVCAAVAHAHRNRIVHRDLKPGNILVTAGGNVKLLDFGTAKLLEAAGSDPTAATRFGMMTLRYASPEQLRGDAVTPSADVYALGVVLYELLTGAWPFGEGGSLAAGLERAVRRVEPARPSSLITGQTAGLRCQSKSSLSRLLDGDLRSVMEKAMEADARDRYPSVEDFSDDLRRWMQRQPVRARRQTLLYRGARLAGRNPWRLAASLVAAAGLTLAALTALQQYSRSHQRILEVRKLSQSYLGEVLGKVEELPGSVSARLLIVDRARRSLEALAAGAPNDRELRRALAEVYLQLADIQGKPFSVSQGDPADALVSYRKAESLAAQAKPDDWEMLAILIRARRTIAKIEARAGQYREALALLQSVIGPAQRLWKEAPPQFQVEGGPAATLALNVNLNLGYTMMRAAQQEHRLPDLERALAQLRRTIAMADEVQAAHPGLAAIAEATSQYAGFALEEMGDWTGEAKYFQESVVMHRRTVAGACQVARTLPNQQTDRNCADAYSELSWAYRNAGDGAAAIAAAREAMARMAPIARSEPNSAEPQRDLAEAYFHLGAGEDSAGKFGEGLRQLRTADATLAPLGRIPSAPLLDIGKLYVDIHREMAMSLAGLHRRAEAAAALRQAIAAAEGTASLPAWKVDELQRELGRLMATDDRTSPHLTLPPR
jgi:serine/threonine protein kinase